jgi:predicted aconitase with swiveling domain
MSYAATETYATLAALVGTTTTVKGKAVNATVSATNPEFVLTGCFLAELPVLDAAMGELSTIDITFVGGVFSTVTTPP